MTPFLKLSQDADVSGHFYNNGIQAVYLLSSWCHMRYMPSLASLGTTWSPLERTLSWLNERDVRAIDMDSDLWNVGDRLSTAFLLDVDNAEHRILQPTIL
eukprot:4734553-Pleurochrysis_carterae.AAC.5